MLARAQLVLVETLWELDYLDEMQFEGLRDGEELTGPDLERILVEDYHIASMPMVLAKARAYNIPPVNISKFRITDHCFEYLEVEFCQKHGILPLGDVGSYLAIASSDPLNPALKASIEGVTRKPFFFLIAQEEHIREKYESDSKTESLSPTVGFGDVVEALGMEFDLDTDKIEEKDFENEESAPVVLLANRIIEDAYFAGSSDIHIEPFEKDTRVRIRVDGVCKERLSIPNTISRTLIARLKVMANLDIAERRISQDGRIVFKQFNRKGIDVDLRVSTAPMNHGEGCVMRLLDKQRSTLPLVDLGFSEENLATYRELIQRPYGMILHSGPTGSGKSMTLYSALNEVNSPELCIRTAEDPIEYTLPGICQSQMNRKIGVTFAGALRAFLRQDPDIILVGEIRDQETANIAIEASLTGHKIFSTVHTNDAPSTINRLLDLKVEPFMISSALICVCAQRLMRRLCLTCKQPYMPEGAASNHLERAIGWHGQIYRSKPNGCPNCSGSGYRGRVGIHELMPSNEELIRGINRGLETAELKGIAIRNGMRTLHQDGMDKVREGITSIEECVATIHPDMEDLEMLRQVQVSISSKD